MMTLATSLRAEERISFRRSVLMILGAAGWRRGAGENLGQLTIGLDRSALTGLQNVLGIDDRLHRLQARRQGLDSSRLPKLGLPLFQAGFEDAGRRHVAAQ